MPLSHASIYNCLLYISDFCNLDVSETLQIQLIRFQIITIFHSCYVCLFICCFLSLYYIPKPEHGALPLSTVLPQQSTINSVLTFLPLKCLCFSPSALPPFTGDHLISPWRATQGGSLPASPSQSQASNSKSHLSQALPVASQCPQDYVLIALHGSVGPLTTLTLQFCLWPLLPQRIVSSSHNVACFVSPAGQTEISLWNIFSSVNMPLDPTSPSYLFLT